MVFASTGMGGHSPTRWRPAAPWSAPGPGADPLSLAAAVSQVLADPGDARRQARIAAKGVEDEFLIDAMNEGTLAVYRSLLATADG